jgi:hypothetical protein
MSSQAQQAREVFGARLREIRKDANLSGRQLPQWETELTDRAKVIARALSCTDADQHNT